MKIMKFKNIKAILSQNMRIQISPSENLWLQEPTDQNFQGGPQKVPHIQLADKSSRTIAHLCYDLRVF